MDKILKEGGDNTRCPHCLAFLREDKTCAEGDYVTCGKCHRRFVYRYRLGPGSKKSDVKRAQPKTPEKPPMHRYFFPWVLALFGIVASYILTQGMKGPDFIYYYIIVFLLIVALGNRLFLRQIPPQFLLFIGIGLGRWQWGITHGMYKFGILWILMFTGIVGLILRHGGTGGGSGSGSCASGSTCSTWGGFWSGSSSGSSCGSSCGGGCGGGGCGGCGS